MLVLLDKYIMYELVCMLVLCGYSNSMHIMHTNRVCILDYQNYVYYAYYELVRILLFLFGYYAYYELILASTRVCIKPDQRVFSLRHPAGPRITD